MNTAIKLILLATPGSLAICFDLPIVTIAGISATAYAAFVYLETKVQLCLHLAILTALILVIVHVVFDVGSGKTFDASIPRPGYVLLVVCFSASVLVSAKKSWAAGHDNQLRE